MITMILGGLKGSADGPDMRESQVDRQTMDGRLEALSPLQQVKSRLVLCYDIGAAPTRVLVCFK